MEKRENLTREYIFKAFIKLLEKKSYNKISVCEITQTAGVSRMSFYRNFNSKEDLTMQGLNEIMKKVNDRVHGYSNVSLYVVALELFTVMKDYKNIFHSLEDSEVSKSLVSLTSAKLRENIPDDYMSKTTKYIPVFYLGAVSTTLFDWIKNGAEETPEEMARMIASLVNFDFDDSHKPHFDE